MSEKIRISIEEVNSAEIDQRLQQREAVGRAQDHYDQKAQAAIAQAAWSQLIFNTMVYMAIFGLLGGTVAWISAEAVFFFLHDPGDEYDYVEFKQRQIHERLTTGEISSAEAQTLRAALHERYADNPYVALDMDSSLSELEKQERREALDGRHAANSIISVLFFFGLVGILLSFSLSIGDSTMSKNLRGAVINGSIGITAGLVGAVVGGIFTTIFLAVFIQPFVDLSSFFSRVVWRTIGWSMLGGSLAIAPGIALKNWKRFGIGLAGGIIGGTIGGLLFDIIAEVTDSAVASRLVAITAIGVVTGVGTGILENATKTGWLRVISGLIAGKQFVLYKNPTFIGSSPQCEIYLFKDPAIEPRHAAIHKVGGGFDIEDLQSATRTFVNETPVKRTRLKNGDQVRIGGTVFVFQERARRK